MKTKSRMPIKIHKNLDRLLAAVAEEEGVSKSTIVEFAIKKAKLIELEDRVNRDYTVDTGLQEKVDISTGKNKSSFVTYAVIIYLIRRKRL